MIMLAALYLMDKLLFQPLFIALWRRCTKGSAELKSLLVIRRAGKQCLSLRCDEESELDVKDASTWKFADARAIVACALAGGGVRSQWRGHYDRGDYFSSSVEADERVRRNCPATAQHLRTRPPRQYTRRAISRPCASTGRRKVAEAVATRDRNGDFAL